MVRCYSECARMGMQKSNPANWEFSHRRSQVQTRATPLIQGETWGRFWKAVQLRSAVPESAL